MFAAPAAGLTRHDAVTDWFLQQVRQRYDVATVSKDDIFYYVYGLLHSADYRKRYAADLQKSLPRLPQVADWAAFQAFSRAGRDLAALHLGYERQPPLPQVEVVTSGRPTGADDYAFYRVDKLRFPAAGRRDEIVYNARIRLKNIPDTVYAYEINGRSPVEWVMERYRITEDKESRLRNDPNDWAREHRQPRYILDLLLAAMTVSVRTQEIIAGLPELATS